MTQTKGAADDGFYEDWVAKIVDAEEELYNTAELLFDRMRAIRLLAKNSKLPPYDPVVIKHTIELQALHQLAKTTTEYFEKTQKMLEEY